MLTAEFMKVSPDEDIKWIGKDCLFHDCLFHDLTGFNSSRNHCLVSYTVE